MTRSATSQGLELRSLKMGTYDGKGMSMGMMMGSKGLPMCMMMGKGDVHMIEDDYCESDSEEEEEEVEEQTAEEVEPDAPSPDGESSTGEEPLEPTSRVCSMIEMNMDDAAMAVLATVPFGSNILMGLMQYKEQGLYIGSTTALIPDASDAAAVGATIADGQSGDTDYPHGKIKPLATVGERGVCDNEYLGEKLTGVPDGAGAYLVDDDTVRIMVQSESYGPILYYT
jgi:hypothetical protein